MVENYLMNDPIKIFSLPLARAGKEQLAKPCQIFLGCGCISSKEVSRRSGDTFKKEVEYKVAIPKNDLTLHLIRKYSSLYVVSCDEYNAVFGYKLEIEGEWLDNNFPFPTCVDCLTATAKRCECSDCKKHALPRGCNIPECGNGIKVVYKEDEDGILPPLVEFINCLTPGTMVCLPSGTYEAGQINVPYLQIELENPDDIVVINGDWGTLPVGTTINLNPEEQDSNALSSSLISSFNFH